MNYWNYVKSIATELIDHEVIEYKADDVVYILQYYYKMYELYRNEKHPRLNSYQLKNVIRKLPYVESYYYNETAFLSPNDYPAIIRQYFSTNYDKCDYRINHFLSGSIRTIKLYELEAQGEIEIIWEYI